MFQAEILHLGETIGPGMERDVHRVFASLFIASDQAANDQDDPDSRRNERRPTFFRLQVGSRIKGDSED